MRARMPPRAGRQADGADLDQGWECLIGLGIGSSRTKALRHQSGNQEDEEGSILR